MHEPEKSQSGDLGRWMQDFLIDHLKEDRFFGLILNRSSSCDDDAPVTDVEQDRIELFKGIVVRLTEMLGTEEAAADWLLHSRAFKSVVGSEPLDYLETGEFWALALLHDMLEVAASHDQGDAVTSRIARAFGLLKGTG